MDDETMLPMDWKPLRKAARSMALELFNAAPWGVWGGPLKERQIEAHILLLADLRRPASRDFWTRYVAEEVGLTVGATAPMWVRFGDEAWILTASTDEQCVMFAEGKSLKLLVRPERAYNVPGISTLTDPAAVLYRVLLHLRSPHVPPRHPTTD